MQSIISNSYDALLAMQDIGSAAITATADGVSASNPNGGPLDLYKLIYGRGETKNHFGIGAFDVLVGVTGLDHTTGDETYVMTFETASAPTGQTWTIQESVALTTAMIGAPLKFAFHPETLKAVDPTAAFLKVKVTLGGTTPILTYWAFASELSHV